jgi:hypothetical protein
VRLFSGLDCWPVLLLRSTRHLHTDRDTCRPRYSPTDQGMSPRCSNTGQITGPQRDTHMTGKGTVPTAEAWR